MPINVFGNSLNNSENKIDTSRFLQKSYLRSNYIETDLDHDIYLKNQYRIINLPSPINDKDGVNKSYIDTKIADIIKKNIQNDDYISFLDNDNVEYKLVKYIPKITLTNVSSFKAAAASNCNFLWGCYSPSGEIKRVIQGEDTITPVSWKTGPGSLYGELSYLSFHSNFLNTNTYAEISRYDFHNIIKIELIIKRYSLNNIMGETVILHKNSNDEWIELYKFNENENITPRDQLQTITLTTSEKNYGMKIRRDKKNSINQMFSISKIVLTYTI